MIDVHAHFADEGYDFPAEWEKIRAAGVETVILAADTLEHAEWHAGFAERHDGCYFTVGVHPEFAPCTVGEKFEALARHPKCVAVGEIGLDYHYPGTDKAAQRALFAEQLVRAAALGLPVEIHSRDACADTLAILRERRELLQRGFLMHCYAYGEENVAAFAELGAYFSFGGVLCFANARRTVEAAMACPADRILTETDSPYLSPIRGQKNTPANLPRILGKLAECRGVSFEEMRLRVRANARALFFS